MNLKDQAAIVTGGARGIGKAVAGMLADHGAKVTIVNVQRETAEQAIAEFRQAGLIVEAHQANVADSDQVMAMAKGVMAAFGRIDILVNNAGITKDELIMRMKEDDWDRVLDVNLKGTFNCIKAVSRHMMKARRGRIVNVSSVIGLIGNPGQANYSASKAGIIGLTKTAAKELAPRNINVNAIAPGYIETDMSTHLSDEARAAFLEHVPLKRVGGAHEVARLVAFLVSKGGDYITGQTICIDGGLTM